MSPAVVIWWIMGYFRLYVKILKNLKLGAEREGAMFGFVLWIACLILALIIVNGILKYRFAVIMGITFIIVVIFVALFLLLIRK